MMRLARRTSLLVAFCLLASAATDADSAWRDEDQAPRVIVEADSLDRIDKDRLLVFMGNAVAWQYPWRLYADRIEVYLEETAPHRIFRATAIGNVRITTGDCRKGRAERVEYHDREQRIVLSGNARLWRDGKVISGENIVIRLPQTLAIDCAPDRDEGRPPTPWTRAG